MATISGMIGPPFFLKIVHSGSRVNRADANPSTVFFFDVDNTLLDNDRVTEHLKRHLAKKVGEASERRYWEIFEELRTELGYADYLGALQRYRIEQPREQKLLAVSHFMVNYPFANQLFPEVARCGGARAGPGAAGDFERRRCGFPAAQDRPLGPV